mgnify:CR=1 FL=1
MASRLQGRDYTTIRRELIEMVRERAPKDWNPSNIADPMIAVIESIAIAADELHYYIDAWRRECDLATATLQSSVYSYALREGYSMILPKGARIRVFMQPQPVTDEDGNVVEGAVPAPVPVNIPKFSRFSIEGLSTGLFAVTDFIKVVSYYGNHVVSDQCVDLVAGNLKTVNFQYSDIDAYSRIELPEPYIDGELFELSVTTPESGTEVWRHVKDVVTAGMQGNIYSLVPTFVSGATRLYIEFPMNYRNVLSSTRVSFTFKYVAVSEISKSFPIVLSNSSIDSEILSMTSTDELKGYKGYESADSVRRNYPVYTRDFTALLTKQDYRLYLSYRYGGRILVYDKQDEYDSSEWKSGMFGLWERSIYIVSELPYEARELARQDLVTRSSRSDMIWMVPFGYYRYGILVVLLADLSSISEDEIELLVENAVLNKYNGTDEIRGPSDSVTMHTVHSTSPLVDSVRVFTFRYESTEFQNIMEMDKPVVKNNGLNGFLSSLTPDYNYVAGNTMPDHVTKFETYQQAVLTWNAGYDSKEFDEYEEGTDEYEKSHYLIPFCQKVVVWSYSV